MVVKAGERSASSATRFTATTPHASSKVSSSRVPPPPLTEGPSKPVAPARGSVPASETLEQRVARLRAAHERAKDAKVSRFDLLVAKSRPFFDSAHRITVTSLVGLTAVAGLLTAYTAYDMLRYNRKRKAEFLEIQRRISADSLEAARLAYIKGDATDEQLALIEEAKSRGNGASETFKLPRIFGEPKPMTREDEEVVSAESDKPTVAAERESSSSPSSSSTNVPKASAFFGWFSSPTSTQKPGGDSQGASRSDAPHSLNEKQEMLKITREAFEKEAESQRKGGLLDRDGTQDRVSETTQSEDAEQPKKSSRRRGAGG